jgi:hypothetical protein
MRCAAKGFICHYDRTGDELFHDETASIQAKVKKAKARSIAARNLQGAPETALVSTMVQGPPVGHYIAPHLVDQGINFFMSYHALGLDQPLITSEAYHQHLATDGFHPVVATTMAALGIAGVANLHLDPSLKRVATNWYLKAIKMVNAAISSPEEVRNDSTLVAVNLLSMFEATIALLRVGAATLRVPLLSLKFVVSNSSQHPLGGVCICTPQGFSR